MDSIEVLLNSLLLILLFPSCISLSISVITLNQSITGSNLLLSRKENFALGFFSPGNCKYGYLGIWYHKLPRQTVVWVANRNNPIMTLQDFDYPTDTMLPGQKLGLNRRIGLERSSLVSWRSADDPGTGDWVYKLNPSGCPQFFLNVVNKSGLVQRLTWDNSSYQWRASRSDKVKNLKVPDASIAALLNTSLSSTECEQLCLNNLFSVAFTIFLIVIFSYLWLRKRRKTGVEKKGFFSTLLENELIESRESPDLPIFNLRAVSAATNNFSPVNKLGKGGFGTVYKGQLPHGQEIAVKRLSHSSGQGISEFKNEVMLIARLQHRNLIKLLGCCIQREERMLIYEYLPNKSLDYFIFDQRQRSILDWNKRFDIIVGIARGILYLHHDSRLRIIHRDLKTSNVLLDADMNPKISDFGMARIFRGDEVQDKTNRVVGTYGYMAPEYVMFGKFSTKSDVFSFGVVLLEIISGKKSYTYYPEDPSLNLIGHVWELWRQGRALDIVDSCLKELSLPLEVMRCIQIGLLCVQEDATDRPTMPNVVLMLNGESTLPCPKQPAFILRNCSDLNLSKPGLNCSLNEVTITKVQAR
uniref:non-specific serine/threonine protein kinase n=1 Tax=Manihot esculenta TaxID=3983 RepID=A0A2C9U4Q8_MANES